MLLDWNLPDHPWPDFTERTLDSAQRYRGALLDVHEDRVQLPNGQEATREYIRHHGAAAIIPLLDEKTVLLEYQFRYPQRRHYFEIPAGKLDLGEDPLKAAQRELQEETGYRAGRWKKLMCLDLCIAYSTEQITYFLAQNLIFEEIRRDEEEFLETLAVPLEEAWRWVETGRICDAKTVAGLLWLKTLSPT
ncbi:ADP-ribose pyrophosphatase [mine drainage metagenome]|uniref:ADP-ribose pyrophosphatase n=1 Tax=mine drainage metagenome TaxID=410659 RepID=A0A3P3ZQP7_9ZZZZ